MEKEKMFGAVIVVIFIGIILYFFISSSGGHGEIPSYVTGDVREVYEWAKTTEGSTILEQIPCYCGCKFEGHLHARHCFWKDDGSFDRHGLTCSVCIDIGKKAKAMHEQGKSICEIRDEIDKFYAPNAELATETAYPKGCALNG